MIGGDELVYGVYVGSRRVRQFHPVQRHHDHVEIGEHEIGKGQKRI